jgi:D-lactate dehydrogenase (cytochrome)
MKNVASLISRLADRFGTRQLSSASALAAYAQGEGPHSSDAPELVLQPVSVEEVRLAVRTAAEMQLPIVAYGAGTSLEGNAAAIAPGTVCIDFSRMDRILDISAGDLGARVEPGVTREALNQELRTLGLFFPVDPGANASLGGMIATRASGTTTVRYGSMRDNVLALKVVTADGGLIRTGTMARKSASGYDLTHLFTGSEGTLGLIVEASLRLHGQPEAILAATWDFASVDGAVETVMATIQSGVAVARMELLDEAAIVACNAQSGLGLPERPMLFLEFHGSQAAIAEDLATVRTIGAEYGGGQLRAASAAEDRNALWKARHHALW